jgi:hypothetical protein
MHMLDLHSPMIIWSMHMLELPSSMIIWSPILGGPQPGPATSSCLLPTHAHDDDQF